MKIKFNRIKHNRFHSMEAFRTSASLFSQKTNNPIVIYLTLTIFTDNLVISCGNGYFTTWGISAGLSRFNRCNDRHCTSFEYFDVDTPPCCIGDILNCKNVTISSLPCNKQSVRFVHPRIEG